MKVVRELGLERRVSLRCLPVTEERALTYIGEPFAKDAWEYRGKHDTDMTVVLSPTDLAYMAGFIDGDGSISSQIVKDKSRKYGFYIRVSLTLYQKHSRLWFLKQMHKRLKHGTLRIRKDTMVEYTLVAHKPLYTLLCMLLPYLTIKRPNALHAIQILDALPKVCDETSFLQVCTLVDEMAQYTDGKRRVMTRAVVESAMHL